MADDKIVTKKTAAKKPAARKTSTKDPSISEPEAQSAKAVSTTEVAEPGTKKKATPKSTAKKSDTPKIAAAETAKTAGTKAPEKSRASTSAKLSDNQGSLRQLATVSPAARLDMIREAAYYKAEKRNFAPGHDAEDWALAEREIDELIARAKVMTGA